MRWWSVCWVVGYLLVTHGAAAQVRRFAVIIGNNAGAPADVELRYAESDAARVARVLRELGGYEPADIVLLQGEAAATVAGTFDAVNERVRAAQSKEGTDTVLFVYYSGHADRRALHLGRSRLEFAKLAHLVRGSPAKVRLLVVDACRAGALTRVKGGQIVPPFEIGDQQLSGEGVAFLTASSADEDAQESDQLKGSFFTHALVSGLLGAADENRDGQVVLQEAYGYAYEATLRATSETLAGAQHPTFRYEVKGQGSLVLTRLAAGDARRAELVFPQGLSFLVMQDNPDGQVIGEVGARGAGRSLSVPPGRYFVRGRGTDHLLEGTVQVQGGQTVSVDTSGLTRVAYARLVRKGARESAFAHGPELGVAVRSQLPNATTPCFGALLGYRFDLENLSLTGRLSGCSSSFENESVSARTNEYGLVLQATHTWDWDSLSAYAGLGLGATLTRQTFETRGSAPPRNSLAPLGQVVLGTSFTVFDRFYVGLEGDVEGHLLKFQSTAIAPTEYRPAAAVRGVLLGGMQF